MRSFEKPANEASSAQARQGFLAEVLLLVELLPGEDSLILECFLLD